MQLTVIDTITTAESSNTPSSAITDQSIFTTAKGGGIVFAGKLFQQGIRFFIGIILARLLGANQLGLYNLTLTAAELATGLAVLGLGPAMVRYVSLYNSRRDQARLWGTLQVGLGVTATLSILTGIGIYILAQPIAVQLFNEPRLTPLLYLAAVLVPILALNDIFAAITQGFNKMHYLVITTNVFQPLVRLILILMLGVFVGLSANQATVAYTVASLLTVIMFVYLLNNLFPLKRSLLRARREIKEILNFSLPVYFSSLIGTFSSNIQTVLLGTLISITSVGIFTVASQINMIGNLFHGSVVTSSMPVISELHDRGEWERLGRLYQTVTKWTLTINLPFFLLIVTFPVSILSIFGKSFVDGKTALVLLAWANLVNVSTGICGAMLDMTGNTRLKLLNSIVTVAANLSLNFLLIPRWGLVGAATAALVAAILLNSLRLIEVFIMYKLTPYNLSFFKPLTAGVIALAASVVLRSLHTSDLSLIIIIDVLVVLLVYGGVIFLLGLSPEDRMILNRIRQRLLGILSKSIS